MHIVFRKCRPLAKGAEAHVYLCDFLGLPVIRKVRVRKRYRHPALDLHIRRFRTKREAKLLHMAKKIGVPVPFVLDVDLLSTTITMAFIEGTLLREALRQQKLRDDEIEDVFYALGEMVGRLHNNGIIHGDLTTSNVIIDSENRLFLIDFGLGEFSHEAEDMGVELRVLWTSLTSAHYNIARRAFSYFLNGYRDSNSRADEAVKAFESIRRRGRYIAERRKHAYLAGWVGQDNEGD